MAIAYVNSDKFGFADGNAGHVCNLGSSPSAGDFDILCVNSDTIVSTPSGFTSTKSEVNNQGAYVFTRKASGGEGSTVTVTTSGNNNCQVTWIRLSGADAVDVAVSTKVDGDSQASSPALSTGTLAASGEAIVAFMAGHRLNTTGNQSPTWSGSYTAAQTSTFGTGNNGVTGMTAYKLNVGTASESPSVTWTGDTIFNRYMFAVTFTAASGGGSNDGTLSVTGTATTASLTGTIDNNATLSVTGDATTASLTGTAGNNGTLDVAGTATTASFTGTVPIDGTLAVVGTATTASFTGTGPVAAAASTRMSRLLARLWFTETLGVERLEGNGAYGPSFASSVSLSGAIDHGSKEVMTPTGDTRISSARVFLPVETDAVPLGSKVTLPDAHGAGTFQVVAVSVHRSGQATPDHVELALL